MKAVVAAFNQEKALVGAFSVITNLRMELSEAQLQTLATVSSLAAVDPVRDILTLGPVCGDQHWPGVSWATCHVSRVPVFRMLGCTGPRSRTCVCALLVTVCMQCCSALCFSMQH